MSAPELRAAIRVVLDQLDDGLKDSVIDALLARGAKAASGWKPARPSPRIVEEAKSFAEAARQIGRADPDDVTEHLRRATKAFLAGDHASARAVFDAILPPIACGDVDLGQHELVEEVLGVSGALPDLEAFLPRWVKRLERFRPSTDDWETEHERWLREAVCRMEGVGGLERIARKTTRPQACLAWCEALADQGDWPGALKASGAAARLVRQSHWRGQLLDGAALAAQELRRSDLPKRLEAAWRASPTLTRLVRWLVADGHSVSAVRTNAKKALALCPKKAIRQVGLLRVLLGDVAAAAALPSEASTRDQASAVFTYT